LLRDKLAALTGLRFLGKTHFFPFEIARSDDFSETQFLQEAKILAGGVASRRGVDVPGYTPATAESQPGSASPSLHGRSNFWR